MQRGRRIEKIKKVSPILVSLLIAGFILGCVEKPSKEEIKKVAEFEPPKIPAPEPIEKKEKPPEEAGIMEKIMGNPLVGKICGGCMGLPCLGNPTLNSLCGTCCCPIVTPCLGTACKLLS
jgi:hypothetical protein